MREDKDLAALFLELLKQGIQQFHFCTGLDQVIAVWGQSVFLDAVKEVGVQADLPELHKHVPHLASRGSI